MAVTSVKKWRPKLSMIIIAVMILIMLVPVGSVVLFRFFDNQLVQQTEGELIAQTSAIAAVMKQYINDADNRTNDKTYKAATIGVGVEEGGEQEVSSSYPLGKKIPESVRKAIIEDWLPIYPKLDLSKSAIYPPRPEIGATETHETIVTTGSREYKDQNGDDDSTIYLPYERVADNNAPVVTPVAQTAETESRYKELAEYLYPVMLDVELTNLSGLRVLDIDGRVIAGRKELGADLSALTEVKTALGGRYASVLRNRSVVRHNPIYSLSRGTKVRVHVSMPVIYQDHVIGAVYGYRTPSNILRELYWQRKRVFLIGCFVLGVVLLIGWMFSRTITRPIEALTERTKRLGNGDRQAIKPLKRHGSREVSELSDGLLQMSEKIFERTDYINTYASHVTHELKSPLTSIRGAVELMLDQDSEMSVAERDKFLQNIMADTQRAHKLLDRLRALAHANNIQIGGSCELGPLLERIGEKYRAQHPDFKLIFSTAGRHSESAEIPVSAENSEIIFSNFIENAINHGATELAITLSADEQKTSIKIKDNGSGVSAGNAARIFNPFFTTRRDAGGTGMGLTIIQAIINAYKGQIELVSDETAQGAEFVLTLVGREAKT